MLLSVLFLSVGPSLASTMTTTSCTLRVAAGRQCGGVAACQNVLYRNQTNAAWADACCPAGHRCTRVTDALWRCAPSPPSSPSPTPLSDWQAAFLDRHNLYRARHRAPALTWNRSLETAARGWANRCTWRHSDAPGLGENLFWSGDRALSARAAGVQSSDLWYSEIRSYDFSRPGFSAATGHATAMLWASTRQLGCAVSASCADGTYVVCNLWPPGNVIGQFDKNVFPPTG